MCNISQSKEQLWSLKSEGIDVLNVWKSFMYYFSVKQTLYYPKFVEVCVNNYSPTERVIMNKNATRILFQVNANVIHEFLNVPSIFLENNESLSKETLVHVYRECNYEIKNSF